MLSELSTSTVSDKSTLPSSGIALSLGSSFRGYYAHCGFLAEFCKSGIQVDRVAGSSSGSIAGLLYALGLREDELVEFILMKGLTRSFFDWGFLYRLPGIVSFSVGTGLFTANGAVARLKQQLGSPTLESFDRPRLEIAVTDIVSAKSLMVSQGDAIELAIASCAMPGLFRARPINEWLLWDGGLANDAPFHHWLDDPTIHTIVLHTIRHTEGSLPVPRWQNMGRGIAVGHQLVANLLNDHRKELAEFKGKRVIECTTETDHPGWSNGKRSKMVEAGRATGRQAAETLRDLIEPNTIPDLITSAERGCDKRPS